MKVKPREALKGFKYYLKSLLLVRSVKRIVMKFIEWVLIRRPYEFKSWSVFMVHNRDLGVLLVDALDTIIILGGIGGGKNSKIT